MQLSDKEINEIKSKIQLPYIELEDKGNGYLETEQNIELDELGDYGLSFDVSIQQPYSYTPATHWQPEEYCYGEANIDISNLELYSDNQAEITDNQAEILINEIENMIEI